MLADHYHIALVVVRHLREQQDSDPILKVLDTTGLTGAVDSTMALEEDSRSSDTAKLYVTGRDVAYQELTLQFRNCVWGLISCEISDPVWHHEPPEFLFRLVDFMSNQKEWRGNATELLAELEDKQTAP